MMGFAPAPTETSYALRSARYLAQHGYVPTQIAQALIEELDLESSLASEIATSIAA